MDTGPSFQVYSGFSLTILLSKRPACRFLTASSAISDLIMIRRKLGIVMLVRCLPPSFDVRRSNVRKKLLSCQPRRLQPELYLLHIVFA